MNEKYMQIKIELLNYEKNTEVILKCFSDLIKIVEIEYEKIKLSILKNYWKKGWLKEDIIDKFILLKKEKLVDYNKFEECNSLLLELKNKNITVLNISFSPIYNSNYTIEGYSIDLYRKGDMLDENIIVKLSECVKNYIGAKDEIKLMKNISPIIYESEFIKIVFSSFYYDEQ